MTIQSSWRTSRLASRAPTTAGMSMLRATMAVCELRAADVGDEPGEHAALELQHVGGATSLATSTNGSSPPKSRDQVCRREWRAPALCVPAPAARARHLLDVGLALAQVLVFHLVELPRQHFELRRQAHSAL
jgi:hypothetical protein